MPRVSIVTAARIDTEDKQRWLGECAQSILRQGYEDWEWVVVDDASPLELDLPDDPRIRWRGFRAARQAGPSLCRNTAVALGRGDAILPLDADDMLAGPDVLGALMERWEADPSKFYYGNLQVYRDGMPGKVVRMGEYTFQNSLLMRGSIPVTALHGVDAHVAGGGWKARLDHGLEDVEYWISLGKTGHCGENVGITTLWYRKHPTSRSAAMRAGRGKRQTEMENLIREMHADVYHGRLPMGCCGGGSRGTTGRALPEKNEVPRALPPELNSTLASEVVWVRYDGGRTGTFSVRGQRTGAAYEIKRTGDVFPIHAADAFHFRGLGRGKDFSVGVPAPESPKPEPEPEPEPTDEYRPEQPEVTTITGIMPEPAPSRGPSAVAVGVPTVVMVEVDEEQETAEIEALRSGEGLSDLDVDVRGWEGVREMLEVEGWTIPALAGAEPAELTPYPGIGTVTAERIVEAAKAWTG